MIADTRYAAFLDRDGVINIDSGYVGRREDFVLADGVIEALTLLRRAGFDLIVVTNQSGIGRGYYTESDYWDVDAYMRATLAEHGIEFAATLHCPHAPDANCECRKPKPGMLIEGARRTGVSLPMSVLFGDKPSDIDAARAAGVGTTFLIGGEQTATACRPSGYGPDLLTCCNQLIGRQPDTIEKG